MTGSRRMRPSKPLDYSPWQLFSSVTSLDRDYVRANLDYRCGRERLWGASCSEGPSYDGKCRGTAECTPHLNNERYECRRPAHSGGPCEDGPLPNGSCCRNHPPCAPYLTMPAKLRRITRLSVVAMVALIATLLVFNVSDGSLAPSSLDPGQLSGSHAGFTSEKGCISCHTGHQTNTVEWILAVFQQNKISDGCISCHEFGGSEAAAHNASFERAEETGAEVSCMSCHTEHKGLDANIVKISDAECGNCHQVRITNFVADHPEFSESYPHDVRVGIKFDHSSHINKHFKDAKVSDNAPGSCSGCHLVDKAERSVAISGFDEGCGACHGDQMESRELVMLRVPEFEENLFEYDDILEVCGPTMEQFEVLQEQLELYSEGEEPEIDEEEEYESVGEDVNEFLAYLLDVDVDDTEDYSEPVTTLIGELTSDGLDPLLDRISDVDNDNQGTTMLSGLSPELIKRVACAWAANIEYEPPAEPLASGWYGEYTEIRYRPLGHGDKTVQSWLEFAIASVSEADEDRLDLALEFRDIVLDPKSGPGLCIKCHVVSAVDGDEISSDQSGLSIAWNYSPPRERAWSKYNHGPHLDILGKDVGCQNCHVLNNESSFSDSVAGYDQHPYESNFSNIKVETCAACHSPRQVKDDCLVCHEYHFEPGFKEQMLAHDESS